MSWTAAPTTRRRLQRQPASDLPPSLSDVFSDTAWDAGPVGFVLSRLPAKVGPVLWVQDRVSRLESGVPYVPGLGALGDLALLRVAVNRPVDALWAMEEGLRCGALRAVIGEIWGDPAVLSFTASKRLALRADASKVPCFLIRRGAAASLSAARDRWRVASLPSAQGVHDPQAPGAARWQVELFRSRRTQPGTWVVGDDGPEASHEAKDRVNLAAKLPDGALDARDVAAPRRATR